MTNQSPARKVFWALGFVPGRCVLRPGVRRLAGLVLALALGLLAGDTGRALARFNPHENGGASTPAALAARGDDFHFELRALDLGRAFRPSDLWELMAESGRVAFKPAKLFNTITVTTTNLADNAGDGQCDLWEAITAANTNSAYHECSAGSVGVDTIDFALGPGTPTMNLNWGGGFGLPNITEGVIIQGNTGGATRVVLDGGNIDFPALSINGDGTSLSDLTITHVISSAIRINASGVTVQNCIITGNNGTGVLVQSGTNNRISGNSIFSNNGLGIDLNSDGVTPNDPNDIDTGPNNLQNFPVISSITSAGLASATLNSTPNTNYTIEFFANTVCDPSGNGQGEVFLGSTSVMTDATGNVSFNFSFAPISGRAFITATATDAAGNTSEFSACQVVPMPGTIIGADFSTGIPPGWQVVDGGDPAVYSTTGKSLTWTTSNPCGETIPSPFVAPFAIVDASCADPPGALLDEELRLPPFDATGLGSVFVEFYSQFVQGTTVTNIGDVDVSTDGGATWTNVLQLNSTDPTFPTPVLESIDIAPFITADPANVLVRLHYYGTSPLASSSRTSLRTAAAALDKVYWAVDFSVYYYTLTPTSQSFAAGGGTGSITVATSAPSPQGQWTAVSNASWITITSPVPVRGNGTVTYSVAPNTGGTRTGTITVSGRTFTVTQAGGGTSGGCTAITIVPSSLSDGVAGKSYSQNVNASPGGSYTYKVVSGSLPQGLTLDAATGKLTGTPKKAGTYSFTIRATVGTCTGSRAYTLRIK